MENTIQNNPSVESKVRHLQKTFFKERIKFLAEQIKKRSDDYDYTLEHYAKIMNLEKVPSHYPSISTFKFLFRHIHIAASLLRGRTREQIERPRDNNLPKDAWIQKYLEESRKFIEQAEIEMRQQEEQAAI